MYTPHAHMWTHHTYAACKSSTRVLSAIGTGTQLFFCLLRNRPRHLTSWGTHGPCASALRQALRSCACCYCTLPHACLAEFKHAAMAPRSLASIAVLLNYTSPPQGQGCGNTRATATTSSTVSFTLQHAGASLAVLCAREPRCLLALFLTPGLLSGLANFRASLLRHEGNCRGAPAGSMGQPMLEARGAIPGRRAEEGERAHNFEETCMSELEKTDDGQVGHWDGDGLLEREVQDGWPTGASLRLLARDCLEVMPCRLHGMWQSVPGTISGPGE